MTNITQFTDIRVGKFPLCFDIEEFNTSDNQGIMATLVDHKDTRIELRKKGNHISLFIMSEGCKLPEFWEDSELLWKGDSKILKRMCELHNKSKGDEMETTSNENWKYGIGENKE